MVNLKPTIASAQAKPPASLETHNHRTTTCQKINSPVTTGGYHFADFVLADFTATPLGKDRLAVVIGTPWPGVITVVGITKNLEVNRSPLDCPLNGRSYPWLLPRWLRMPVGMAIDVMAEDCRAINAGNGTRPRLRPHDEATLGHFVRLATSS